MTGKTPNVRPLDEGGLDAATEFVFGLLRPSTRSYPVFSDKAAVRRELEYCHADGAAFCAFCGGRLSGVAAGFGEGDEYFQTTLFYVAEDDRASADALIDAMVNSHAAAQILIGIDGRNVNVGSALTANGFEAVENDVDARLDTQKLVPSPCGCVQRLGRDKKNAWLEFHRRYFDDVYWNAEHIEACFDEWDIYAAIDGEKVTDGAFVKAGKDGSAEIFGLQARSGKSVAALLTAVAQDQKARRNVKTIVFFIDCDCADQIDAAKAAGFDCGGQYKCYELKTSR